MRTTVSPARGRRVRLLYTGLAVFVLLAALTARTVWRAWQERAGQARSAAVFALVEQRMPSRPIEAPGAIAWLREQLAAYRGHLQPRDASVFERLSNEADGVPGELQAAVLAMRPVAAAMSHDLTLPSPVPVPHEGPSRRSLSLLTAHGTTFVVTRRRALEADTASNAFVSRLLEPMAAARPRLEQALGGVARPVRLYALAEDGTLASLPWPSAGETTDGAARGEALQLSSRPTLPSFAPEEFFFRFSEGEQDPVRYSGFYVDLGGRGLVSTLTMPIEVAGGVLALDLSHAVDWDHFAATIAPPLAAVIVRTGAAPAASWAALRAGLADGAPPALRAVMDDAVASEGSSRADVAPISHTVLRDVGAVAAFHVSEQAWLLAFFPSAAPSFPGGAVALLGAVLAVLLTGFEVNRRKAEREADRAARALGEKQNLLNTMQVPLVVVDPNTDEIVSANQVAESIGITRGARFADRVSADPRARAHYDRTQVATGEPRRAYGVPIRVENGSGQAVDQFALVRSVAVTAPIEALAADERHRLAILFLVDPRSDLRLLLEDVESAAHTDERRRLAGLLSHGLDSVADVLRRSLAAGGVRSGSERGQSGAGAGSDRGQTGVRPGSDPGPTPWLAEYLQRRIHVTAWLLDHWHEAPPAHEAVVDAAQAQETLSSLEQIFTAARRDPDLRARLGWTNGPLSHAGHARPFEVAMEWPPEFETTLPVRGGLGFFLTEVLSNAMRHGAPGSAPRVSIRCDRVKKELVFAVENERRDDRARPGSKYGGLALLAGMARLFGWRELTAAPDGNRFVVSWRAPLTRRDRPGRPD